MDVRKCVLHSFVAPLVLIKILLYQSANCEGNPGFTPVANGGDGEMIQFFLQNTNSDN
ncbi:hypothetical protein PTI98_008046 [Pleurotus ostreatus]|nr:hypothetical protein PTI98_008046 [Pleurotus ostreatus]